MATRPAGESQYGNTSFRSNPGRRDKTRRFDTSIRNTSLVLGANPTVAAARAAVATAVIAARAVARRTIGLARSVPSGGQVLTVAITSGGSGYGTTTGTALTGGNGSGAVASLTNTAGAITSVTITNGGRGYTVGDVLSEGSVAGTGLALTVTAVS
jgi:hypothetical protein